MDPIEVQAMALMATRQGPWGVDELPQVVDADVLRGLDSEAFIEVRFVTMQNQAKYPGDPTPPVPSPSVWFSPMRNPAMAGGWDQILAERERSVWKHPHEIRLTERGLLELARIRRAQPSSPRADADAMQESPPPGLTQNDVRVLRALGEFDPTRLLSAAAIEQEMEPADRLSERTIGEVLRKLIPLGLVERPEGERRGARLTTRGRRLLPKIAR
jgi:hypothetical protein